MSHRDLSHPGQRLYTPPSPHRIVEQHESRWPLVLFVVLTCVAFGVPAIWSLVR